MGKEAQNKGYAKGAFYGFDYGKPYEGSGVSSSIKEDFSFEDPYAKAPAIFRGSSFLGQARHGMYRNYNVFYDTTLAERMEGAHLLRKMITGESPSEDVIKSYPGLRQELHNIQERTPSPEDLLKHLSKLREGCKEGSVKQALIDTYIMQISAGKLQPFDLYFAEIKIDLIVDAMEYEIPDDELIQYIKFIDEMAVTAAQSNKNILKVFEQRLLLTKDEIDLLDKLEKIFSPTSVMSHDGTVFLNTMRFDPPAKRVPFNLVKEENDTYTLSTTDMTIAKQLKDQFGLDFVAGKGKLSCNLTQKNLLKLMADADVKYHQVKEEKLIVPTYRHETALYLRSLMNDGLPPTSEANIGYMWREDKSLSIRILPKTEEQVKKIEAFFGVKATMNEAILIEVPPERHRELQKVVAKAYEHEQGLLKTKTTTVESTVVSLKTDVVIEPNKWELLKEKALKEEPLETTTLSNEQMTGALIKRLQRLITEPSTSRLVEEAIKEMNSKDIKQLSEYNDKTLASPDNIKCILEERLDEIRIIVDEVISTPPTVGGDNPFTI